MSVPLLNGIRVVDAATGEAAFCGHLLQSFGAEVIKVELPEGDPGRRLPPFADGEGGARTSLFWEFLNKGKELRCLDLAQQSGREELRRLLADADVFVESFSPGYLSEHGLDPEELSRTFPRLVHTSITPFGQDGPYAQRPASDLVLMAMSGFLAGQGYLDRPPNRVSLDQAYAITSSEALAGTMMALVVRETTGRGQRVDVAALDTMVEVFSRNALSRWLSTRESMARSGAESMQMLGMAARRSVFHCADGLINFQILGGVNTHFVQALADWMRDLGWQGEAAFVDWRSYTYGSIAPEDLRRLEADFEAFFMTKTTDELMAASTERGIMIYPISRPHQILHLTPFVESGLFVEDDLGGVRVQRPGPFFRSSRLEWEESAPTR